MNAARIKLNYGAVSDTSAPTKMRSRTNTRGSDSRCRDDYTNTDLEQESS